MKKSLLALCVLLLAALLASSQAVRVQRRTAAGGSSDFVHDTLTEASDLTLASHTPEVGGPITKHPDASYTSTITIDAASDEGFPLGITAYYYDATPSSADYDVDMVVHVWTIENINFGPYGHVNTSANTMVGVRLNSGTSWDLRELSAGSGSTLATTTTSLPNAGDTVTVTLRFSNGGTKAAVLVNGSEIIPATTISVTAAGKVGMRASSGATSSTGFHVTSLSAR